MMHIVLEDVRDWAADASFLKSCAASTLVSEDALKKLCLYFPTIPPEFKSILVDLAMYGIPRNERPASGTQSFNAWATFAKEHKGGLVFYTSLANSAWARIHRTQVFKERNSEKRLYLGNARRVMALNFV